MIANKVFIIATFYLAATSASTSFKRCLERPIPLELRVEGCTDEPCAFYWGTEVAAEWDFTVVADTANLRPEVWVKNIGLLFKYQLPEQDACKSLTNGERPLDGSEEVTYRLKMPIRFDYLKLSLALQFSLVDDSGNPHVCFNRDAKIVDKIFGPNGSKINNLDNTINH